MPCAAFQLAAVTGECWSTELLRIRNTQNPLKLWWFINSGVKYINNYNDLYEIFPKSMQLDSAFKGHFIKLNRILLWIKIFIVPWGKFYTANSGKFLALRWKKSNFNSTVKFEVIKCSFLKRRLTNRFNCTCWTTRIPKILAWGQARCSWALWPQKITKLHCVSQPAWRHHLTLPVTPVWPHLFSYRCTLHLIFPYHPDASTKWLQFKVLQRSDVLRNMRTVNQPYKHTYEIPHLQSVMFHSPCKNVHGSHARWSCKAHPRSPSRLHASQLLCSELGSFHTMVWNAYSLYLKLKRTTCDDWCVCLYATKYHTANRLHDLNYLLSHA